MWIIYSVDFIVQKKETFGLRQLSKLAFLHQKSPVLMI